MKTYRLLGRIWGLPWSVLCDEVPQEKQLGVLSIFQFELGKGWEFYWEVA